MQTSTDISKTLERDKRNLIIQRFLKDKYKENFNPLWLTHMGNYDNLGAAIDFFYQLNHDKLNLSAIGSDNLMTQSDYEDQYKRLVFLLDKVVVFAGDNPPVATKFNDKEAVLYGLALNQDMDGRSLRDLHAQASNLGIAEKLLNEELGQTEWLGEVDLERMLIKLGVKDRTHITRLNAEDIGMILHFEREKNANAQAPYHIPLLLNCGSSGSLGSQGAHWTYAMVTVDPTTNSVTINYHDSMPLKGTERAILEAAIDYTDGNYSAFPGATTKVVTPVSDGLQEDSWSCGYRALKGLISAPNFPTHGGVAVGNDWARLVQTNMESGALRNTVYQTLLSDIAVDEDYFVAMKLDSDIVKKSSKGYEVNDEYTKRYLDIVTQPNKKNEMITTNHFGKQLEAIAGKALKELNLVVTDRSESVNRLKTGFDTVMKNDSLSADGKIIALLDVYTKEYETIAKSRFGSGSKLGKFIKSFCDENFGVELDKDGKHRLKSKGLMMNVLTAQVPPPKKVEGESLLPPTSGTKVTPEPKKVSQSAPLVQRTISIKPKVSPSEGSIKIEGNDFGKKKLRTNKTLSRVGTMFGEQQFCYAEKPGGVEPGFRAIDLDGQFFIALNNILSEENLSKSKLREDVQGVYMKLNEALNKVDDLPAKQKIFANFINQNTPGPHQPGVLRTPIDWLAKQVKGAVDNNKKLSAWMYKLDYAEGEENRTDANKEAIREYVGTCFARVFSAQNQKQEVAWVQGQKGVHAVLACGWKQGLEPLKGFLHGGGEPDYNGILVDGPKSPTEHLKYSKHIPGMGRNLMIGLAIGDRDGMGKEAQNKGLADGAFYGFDYGKTYEGEGVCQSLQDDFSFENPYANYPAIFRGSSKIGLARHYMYRNFSVFYDTDLSERMVGLHLMRKMITGENPSDEIIKSYPGLRHELNRIEEVTPTPKELLNELAGVRANCKEGSPQQRLVDTYIMQISTGKLSHFDRYFTQIKIGIINDALQNNIPYSELEGYMTFIDEMAATAANNNQAILETFDERALLTKQEIDLIDRLEKIYSPATAMSHGETVVLNTLRIDPPNARIPFQIKREKDGTYTLSTTDQSIDLRKDFGLAPKKGETSSCKLTAEELVKVMQLAATQYNNKRDDLLMKPTYQYETEPRMRLLINNGNSSKGLDVDLRSVWAINGDLSFNITPKTQKQVEILQELFDPDVPFAVNVAQILRVPAKDVKEFKAIVHESYDNVLEPQSKVKTKGVQNTSEVGIELMPIGNKWGKIHQNSQEPTSSSKVVSLVEQEAQKLIKRYEGLVSVDDLGKLKDAIAEMDITSIQKLLSYNDKTLGEEKNVSAVIAEEIESIKVVEEEVVVTPSKQNPTDVVVIQNNLSSF